MAVLRTRPPPSLWSSPRETARTLGTFRATAFVEARFYVQGRAGGGGGGGGRNRLRYE